MALTAAEMRRPERFHRWRPRGIQVVARAAGFVGFLMLNRASAAGAVVAPVPSPPREAPWLGGTWSMARAFLDGGRRSASDGWRRWLRRQSASRSVIGDSSNDSSPYDSVTLRPVGNGSLSLDALWRRRLQASLTFREHGSTEPLVERQEEVLTGVLSIEGIMPLERVAEIGVTLARTLAHYAGVQEFFAKCRCISTYDMNTAQAAETFNMSFSYEVLPVIGGAVQAARAILESGYDAQPMPTFLVQLQLVMNLWEPTLNVLPYVFGWGLHLPTPMVEDMVVRRPQNMAVAAATSPTPAPSVYGASPPVSAVDQLAQQEMARCASQRTACNCANIGGCTWTVGNGCTPGQSGVTCAVCQTQTKCPGWECRVYSTPCICADSTLNCVWDTSEGMCRLRQGAGTSCASCPRQAHCQPPAISGWSPPQFSSLTPPDQLSIRISFDRAVILGPGLASIKCSPRTSNFYVPDDSISTISSVSLVVSLATLVRNSNFFDQRRECDLVLDEGLVTDTDGVPFLGLNVGGYKFEITDTAGPRVLSYAPRNGADDVAPGVEVAITFNEPVLLPGLKAALWCTLTALEDSNTGATDPAQLPADEHVSLGSDRVVVDGTVFRINLNGVVVGGKLYSLSLPLGAVTDRDGNDFSGLSVHAYTFRTGHGGSTASTAEAQGGTLFGMEFMSLVAAICGSVGAVGLTAAVCWRIRKLQQMHTVNQRVASTKSLNAVRPTGGSHSASHSELRHSASAALGGHHRSMSNPKYDRSSTSPDLNRRASEPPGQAPLPSFWSDARYQDLDGSNSWASRSANGWNTTQGSEGRDLRRSKTSTTTDQPEQRRSAWTQPPPDSKQRSSASTADPASPHSPGTRDQRRSATTSSSTTQRGTAGADPTSPTTPHSTSGRSAGTAAAPAGVAAAQRAAKAAAASAAFAAAGAEAQQRNGGSFKSPSASSAPRPQQQAQQKTGAGSTDGPRQSTEPKGGTEKSSARPSAGGNGGGDPSSKGASRPSENSKGTSKIERDLTIETASEEDKELARLKSTVESRLRGMMEAPQDERKKALRELMLQYHPDKNQSAHAKEMFQFINSSRAWFLTD